MTTIVTFLFMLTTVLASSAATNMLGSKIEHAYGVSLAWGEASTSVLFGIALGLTIISRVSGFIYMQKKSNGRH